MTVKIGHEGATRTITSAKFRFGGVTRQFKSIKTMESDTVRTVATFVPPLTVSAIPGSLNEQGDPGSDLTTATTTATPVGGTPPYTYLWTKVSGTEASILSPTSASTKFSKIGVGLGSFSATFNVVCTDSAGLTASDNCTVTFVGVSSDT